MAVRSARLGYLQEPVTETGYRSRLQERRFQLGAAVLLEPNIPKVPRPILLQGWVHGLKLDAHVGHMLPADKEAAGQILLAQLATLGIASACSTSSQVVVGVSSTS